MNWSMLQQQFSRALKEPELPVPDAVGKSKSQISVKRFNVYRNNSAVSLREALAAGFPVVSRLVGEEFFGAMTGVFMERHLPKNPVLISYGKEFPDFIDSFEPAASIPFLGDVARLEWAWTQAYNGGDAPPLTIEQLAAVPPDDLVNVVLEMHPTLRVVRSQWPVFSIWSAHQREGTGEILARLSMAPETGMLIRPELLVKVMMLSPMTHCFLIALMEGDTIGQAFDRLESQAPEDLSGNLLFLFNNGAITGITVKTSE